jgi:hypothetical protein
MVEMVDQVKSNAGISLPFSNILVSVGVRLTNRKSMFHKVIQSIVDVVDKRDTSRLAVVCDWITDIDGRSSVK